MWECESFVASWHPAKPAILALCAPTIRIDYCVYGWQLEHKGEIKHYVCVLECPGSGDLRSWHCGPASHQVQTQIRGEASRSCL